MHVLIENKLAALGTIIDDGVRQGFSELSQSAAAALLTLRYRGPLTTTELAAIIGVTQPTAVRLIDGLVRSKLVRRGSRQGKSAPLHLESKGRRRANQLQTARLGVTGDLLQGLTVADRRALDEILDKLLSRGTSGWDHARISCRYCAHDRCAGKACPIGSRARHLRSLEEA